MKLSQFGTARTGPLAGIDTVLTQPLGQGRRVDTEVLGDPLQRHPVLTAVGNPNNILAELPRVGLRHIGTLPADPTGQPSQMSPKPAADPNAPATAASGEQPDPQPADDDPSHTPLTRCCDKQLNPPSLQWSEFDTCASDSPCGPGQFAGRDLACQGLLLAGPRSASLLQESTVDIFVSACSIASLAVVARGVRSQSIVAKSSI